MRFDPQYMKEVKHQLTELEAYLIELKSTINLNIDYVEYSAVEACEKAAGQLQIGLDLLPKPDYSFLEGDKKDGKN